MKNPNIPKLIFFHPSTVQKPGLVQHLSPAHRLYVLASISLFGLLLLFTLILTTKQFSSNFAAAAAAASASSTSTASFTSSLPTPVVDALLHYAASSNSSFHMSLPDLRSISSSLRRCSPSCSFLIFGLGHETLLWHALNPLGRNVFLDENEYYASWFEQRHPHIEAYDVRYTTKVSQFSSLLSSTRDLARNDCRPVQNLLFSDCPLALNDLPNQLYDIDWDVIVVDGPRGYSPSDPGRMSSVFTAAVLAHSRRREAAPTHVFVHDFERQVERHCSEEFLCFENLVAGSSSPSLAHFVIEKMDPNSFEFCRNRTFSLPSTL